MRCLKNDTAILGKVGFFKPGHGLLVIKWVSSICACLQQKTEKMEGGPDEANTTCIKNNIKWSVISSSDSRGDKPGCLDSFGQTPLLKHFRCKLFEMANGFVSPWGFCKMKYFDSQVIFELFKIYFNLIRTKKYLFFRLYIPWNILFNQLVNQNNASALRKSGKCSVQEGNRSITTSQPEGKPISWREASERKPNLTQEDCCRRCCQLP